jgi:hypothetical protein
LAKEIRHKPDPPSPSEYQKRQDAWQAEMVRAVGIAIANYVDQAGLQRQRLDALTIEQYEAIGVAACTEYVRQREMERLNSSLPRQEWEM